LSNPLVTKLLSHITEIHTAQISFPTYIDPLLISSISRAEFLPDFPARSVMRFHYSEAAEAGPSGGFPLSTEAARDGLDMAAFCIDHSEEAKGFGAPDEFGDESEETELGFGDSLNEDYEDLDGGFDDYERVTAAPTHGDVVEFVDALPTVDISTIA
jgi:hypothetical protein